MSLSIRSTILSVCAFILASCGPSKEQDVEAEVADLQKKMQQTAVKPADGTLPSPSEILDATGLTAKDERAEIILLLPDSRIAFQEFQRNGLAMLVSRQAGYKLTPQDATGDAARQLEQFRQAIAAKPAAIIVSPIDPPALAALIVEANTAGIITIGLDKRMLKDGCASVVYSDQRRIGQMAAQTVIEALKRKASEESRTDITGRVVQLRGAEDSFTSNEIAEGFLEGLHAESGVIVVHDAPADWSAENGTQRVAEAFRLQQNFDAIYAHNDAIALGAAKGAETAGQRENIFIVGTDGLAGQKRGIDLVRQSEIDATVVQPALVDLALQVIVKLRADKTFKPQPFYEVQPVTVVPKNVDQCLRTGTYKLPKL